MLLRPSLLTVVSCLPFIRRLLSGRAPASRIGTKPLCTATAFDLYDAPTCNQALVESGGQGFGQSLSLPETAVRVFTNPSNGVFRLEAGASAGGRVAVLNAVGQRVHSTQLNDGDFRDIDLSHLENGIYTIRIQGSQSAKTLRVMLTR